MRRSMPATTISGAAHPNVPLHIVVGLLTSPTPEGTVDGLRDVTDSRGHRPWGGPPREDAGMSKVIESDTTFGQEATERSGALAGTPAAPPTAPAATRQGGDGGGSRRPHRSPPGARRGRRVPVHRSGRARPDLRAPLDHARHPSLRRDRLGDAHREHLQRVGQDRVRADGHRGALVLEPAGHQRRRQQVLPRPHRHAPAREERQAAHRPGRQHHHGLGGHAALLRHGRGPPGVQGGADPSPGPPEDGLQQPRLVQRGRGGAPAVLGLLHQLRPGHRCPRSWTSPRPRPCCSSTARAPASTCRPSGAARSGCRAAASPAARSAS